MYILSKFHKINKYVLILLFLKLLTLRRKVMLESEIENVSTTESKRTSFLDEWVFFDRGHKEHISEFVEIVGVISRVDLSTLSFRFLQYTWRISSPFFVIQITHIKIFLCIANNNSLNFFFSLSFYTMYIFFMII